MFYCFFTTLFMNRTPMHLPSELLCNYNTWGFDSVFWVVWLVRASYTYYSDYGGEIKIYIAKILHKCTNAKCKSCVSHSFHKRQPQIVMWKVLPRHWLSYLSGLSCQLYLLSIQWDWNIFEVALKVSRSQKKIVEPQLLPKDKQTNLFFLSWWLFLSHQDRKTSLTVRF